MWWTRARNECHQASRITTTNGRLASSAMECTTAGFLPLGTHYGNPALSAFEVLKLIEAGLKLIYWEDGRKASSSHDASAKLQETEQGLSCLHGYEGFADLSHSGCRASKRFCFLQIRPCRFPTCSMVILHRGHFQVYLSQHLHMPFKVLGLF